MSKKRSSATAVKTEPAPIAPASFEERIRYSKIRVEDAVSQRRRFVEEFRAEVATGDRGCVAHALQWKGENALRAEAFLELVRPLPGFLDDVAGAGPETLDKHLNTTMEQTFVGEASAKFLAAIGCSVEEGVALGVAVMRLREERDRLVRTLCGDGYASPANTGPWTHCSTNALTNISAACTADATRQAYSLISSLLEYFESGVL